MLLATLALGAALFVGDTASAAPATWTIDRSHSEMSFRVRHLNGRVRGTFQEWSATITADADSIARGSVEVEVKAATIDTENERRDNHLRSPDFFDAVQFPTLTFRSTKVELNGKDLAVTGDLTIKGVTKPVVLKGTYNGRIMGPMGKERMGFEVSTTIDRREFGLVWNRVVEGTAMVGDEVTIDIAIEAVKS